MSLVLQDLVVRLPDGRRLGPVSAEVGAGDVLVLMGPSGVGKSSLLAWVAGLLEPPLSGQGQVVLDGRDVTALPAERRRIGLLFQDDLLFPHWSVWRNLLFACPGGPRAAREAAVVRALQDAELQGLEARRPHELSGGQRARVSLMRALLAEPRALLLDEPFGGLDSALRQRVRAFTWQTLAARGVPALLVTHDAQDVPTGAQVRELLAHA